MIAMNARIKILRKYLVNRTDFQYLGTYLEIE